MQISSNMLTRCPDLLSLLNTPAWPPYMHAVFLKSGHAYVKISSQHKLHEASHICSTPATPLQSTA